jgi:hypothetical protein
MINKIKEAIRDKVVSTFDNIRTVYPYRKKQYITVPDFFAVLRMVEAERILLKSNFKKYAPKKQKIIQDILGAIVGRREFKHKASPIIANAYLKSLPIFTSVKEYNLDDLALAISNHYHPSIIPVEVFHINGLKVEEAVLVCRAILDDFDHTASRMDGIGISGEFIKYASKPALYFNAIETRRAFQYQSVHGKDWTLSERYKVMCEKEKEKQALLAAAIGPIVAVSESPVVEAKAPTLSALEKPILDVPKKPEIEPEKHDDAVEPDGNEDIEYDGYTDVGFEESSFFEPSDEQDEVVNVGDAEEVDIDELDLQSFISK